MFPTGPKPMMFSTSLNCCYDGLSLLC